MSYCRFSSDSFRCDLYVYADVTGGYTTHVAAYKYPDDPDRPLELTFTKENVDSGAWLESHQKLMAWLEANEDRMQPIGGPYAGESFNDATIEECKARLLMLREAGYRFPDYVLDKLDDEAADDVQGT